MYLWLNMYSMFPQRLKSAVPITGNLYPFFCRSGMQDQNTKVAVVLIQKNAPLPPGEVAVLFVC